MGRNGSSVIFALVFLGLLVGTALAENRKRDFRNVNWGMTRLEVMANEEKEPEHFDLQTITYLSEIQGRTFYLAYKFIHNQLYEAYYYFDAHNVRNYNWLKKLIEMKYGVAGQTAGEKGGPQFRWENRRTEITLMRGRIREYVVRYRGRRFIQLKTGLLKERLQQKNQTVRNTF